jgi:hypothetical protein
VIEMGNNPNSPCHSVFPNSTGVENEHICLLLFLGLGEAILKEEVENMLRAAPIHLAAKGHQSNRKPISHSFPRRKKRKENSPIPREKVEKEKACSKRAGFLFLNRSGA